MYIPAPLIERFNKAYIPVTESGCWLWIGSVNNCGYGKIYHKNKSIGAHRFSYQHFIGPIPDNLVPDHLCRVRCCVNPSHMRLVSSKENILAGVGPAAINARKTHCLRGHSLDASNVYIRPGVYGRYCRECKRIRRSNYKKRIIQLRASK